MARRTVKPNRTKTEGRPRWLGLGPMNALVIGLGLLAIVAGYLLLDRGSVSAAPVLLVIGYAVLVPAGLLIGLRRHDRQ